MPRKTVWKYFALTGWVFAGERVAPNANVNEHQKAASARSEWKNDLVDSRFMASAEDQALFDRI
jgi:hypothetical protein